MVSAYNYSVNKDYKASWYGHDKMVSRLEALSTALPYLRRTGVSSESNVLKLLA